MARAMYKNGTLLKFKDGAVSNSGEITGVVTRGSGYSYLVSQEGKENEQEVMETDVITAYVVKQPSKPRAKKQAAKAAPRARKAPAQAQAQSAGQDQAAA